MEWELRYFDLGSPVGHEQGWVRPCVILRVFPGSAMGIILPITKNMEAANFPYTLTIKRNYENNLKEDSVILINQIRTLSFNRITSGTPGKLEQNEIDRIKELLRDLFRL